jgi:hypothetical protein
METIGMAVGVLFLFVVGLTALLVLATVKVGQAVSRKVEKHGALARRAVEDATLKVRSFGQSGPQGRIAALRLEVRSSLSRTRQVLERGVGADSQLTDTLNLVGRLEKHAAELDSELQMLEREPGAQRVEAKLPGLRERAERVVHAADTLRWAAQDRAQRFSDEELAWLGEECEREAGALRHWAPVEPLTREPAAPAARPAAAGDSAPGGRQPAAARPGLPTGRVLSAEEMLGLADSRTRLADRLRKQPRSNSGPAGAE